MLQCESTRHAWHGAMPGRAPQAYVLMLQGCWHCAKIPMLQHVAVANLCSLAPVARMAARASAQQLIQQLIQHHTKVQCVLPCATCQPMMHHRCTCRAMPGCEAAATIFWPGLCMPAICGRIGRGPAPKNLQSGSLARPPGLASAGSLAVHPPPHGRHAQPWPGANVHLLVSIAAWEAHHSRVQGTRGCVGWCTHCMGWLCWQHHQVVQWVAPSSCAVGHAMCSAAAAGEVLAARWRFERAKLCSDVPTPKKVAGWARTGIQMRTKPAAYHYATKLLICWHCECSRYIIRDCSAQGALLVAAVLEAHY